MLFDKAAYFNRHNVALQNLYEYFDKIADKHEKNARRLLKYQNKRGGIVKFNDIKAPDKNEWNGPLDVFQCALELEKTINQSYLDLIQIAENHNDHHLSDYIKDELLDDIVELIKNFGDKITNLKQVGKGLGEYLFDQSYKL